VLPFDEWASEPWSGMSLLLFVLVVVVVSRSLTTSTSPMSTVRVPASSIIISTIVIINSISVLISTLIFAITPIAVHAIVRVAIKLTISFSAPSYSTLAYLETPALFEPADVDEETPDFVRLLSPRSSSPQTKWARADGLVSAHDMVNRLPRISARLICDVTHCPTK
jgi:hypothetical protein